MPTAPAPSPVLEQAIIQMGQTIWTRMKGEMPGVFNKDYWQGRILEWAMKDPSFKVDMFRFVDVLPVLSNKDQISQHIKEYLLKEGRELPTTISMALKAATTGLTAGIAAATIKKNVTDMAERFIVGQNAKEALPILKKLHKDGIAFTVDLLGETTVSDGEADTYASRYLDLVDNLPAEVSKFSADELIDKNHLGNIPRTNVSLKLSALAPFLDPVDMQGSVEALYKRALPIFLRAKERGVFVNVDLEQWSMHDITYDLFEKIATHPELKSYPHIGIVVQAYLKSSAKDVERLLNLAKFRGAPITVRLVKGAYWDYETVVAKQQGWECPVFSEKAQTDASYEALTRKLLENIDHLQPAFGSHNLRSLTHALVLAKEMNIKSNAFELQMLYGMAEPERMTFRALGHRVRVYAPVGELLPGMAYLVRRLLENTSNSGFLKLSHHDGVDTNLLLQSPQTVLDTIAKNAGKDGNKDAGKDAGKDSKNTMKRGDLSSPFVNCPLTDFSIAERRKSFDAALKSVQQKFPLQVPVVIAGNAKKSTRFLDRPSPSNTQKLVAKVALASIQEANEAVSVADAAYPAWRDLSIEERAKLLEALADKIEQDRDAMSALQVHEVGKTWKEADADVAEAVDFCRYYARQAQGELGARPQGSLFGEDNTLFYEGRGVYAIIAPWNFPLAILAGMATAALVAGNTIVMKPAEQSSAVAYGLYEKMRAVGFPKDVVQFLPGLGEEVGDALVSHPLVAGVAFTGSQHVGLMINEKAAKVVAGQRQVRRVICEMGGKNAIIVDNDADLDEAAAGILKSAFGFSGQKCSACSRVIVVGDIYQAFVKRLVEACHSIPVGGADSPHTVVGPVVDQDAYQRLLGVIQSASGSGANAEKLFVGTAPQGGYYVPPALFAVKDEKHVLMQQEFFGPVVAVINVPTFADALRVASSTIYALTGAVYSRSPKNLDDARKHFRVGNLYLNRGSTGALVHRQPFGGFAMSGGGTKAGGPGYLLHFADPRCITENTLRRGFTPDLES